MKKRLKIQLLWYRFFSGVFGKIILQFLSIGVRVKNLRRSDKNNFSKKYPFLVIITTDTESGYVEKNQRRVWQMEKPEAFQGYYYGIRNLMKIFDKYGIKTTFFLSTQCFSAGGKNFKQIKKELKNVIRKGHEIGLHSHADSDFSIQKKLSKKFDATSAFFYTYEEKLRIIKTGKELIKEHLGKSVYKNLISFRWGNWALDSGGAKALNKTDFRIDSSAIPGIKGHTHDTMKHDWSKVNTHYPWKLSISNYQTVNHNNSNIVEIPIATFDFFGLKMRADPIYSVLLNKAFTKYYKKADRLKRPFPFVVMTHSSEATTKNGKFVQALRDLDAFIHFAKKKKDVEFVTLREAYDRITIS